jgi:hypothetical protein
MARDYDKLLGSNNGSVVGPFRRYIDAGLNATEAEERRRGLIQRVEKATGRRMIIYAADPRKGGIPGADVAMLPTDHTPLVDILDTIPRGSSVDMLVESPGGLASVAEYISRILRERFDGVRFFVPHMAMSAATILVMSGDEILMDDRSSLGPIDPQIQRPNAIPYPAQSYLDYLDQVAEEEAKTGRLSLATLAILSRVTPADIQIALDATEEARLLVRSWLRNHMWRSLKDGNGNPVPLAEVERKAKDVAESLASHKKWLNHGKMLSRSDLLQVDPDLRIVDYSKLPNASDLWEIWVNLHYSFGIGSAFKYYESSCSRIVKNVTITGAPVPQGMPPMPQPPGGGPLKPPTSVIAGLVCPNCGTENRVQADFEPGVPPNPQAQRWPAGDRMKCAACQTEIDLRPLRVELKRGLGREVIASPTVAPGPTP